MPKKKKEEINLEELNLDELLQETVASSRLGRALASLGAVLTGREKHDAGLVYVLLRANKNYSKKLPVTASITKTPEKKKYSPAESIRWFSENYPKEAEPLLRRLQEEYKESKTFINYGLREKKDLPDKFYIGVLSTLLNISEDRATTLYHSIIKPSLEKEEEESRLISLAINKNKTK